MLHRKYGSDILNRGALKILEDYRAASPSHQLSLFALLMEDMEHGLINESNNVELGNVFEPDDSVLLPWKIGLCNGTAIAFEVTGHIHQQSIVEKQGELPPLLDLAQSSWTFPMKCIGYRGSFTTSSIRTS